MEILNALTTHEWTIFTFILASLIIIAFPFKGDSVLKLLLTHFSQRKKFELQLIEKYQSISNGLQEENNKLKERILLLEKKEDEQEEEIRALQIKLHELELKLVKLGG
jgi:peptidoglycan hydrolase CwlO-like protein